MHRSTLAESHLPPANMPSSTTVIRPFASLAEFGQCVALQRQIWGEEYDEVPSAILQVSTHVGGIAAGAFDTDGQLVGFVFGLTGPDGSKLIHWSHMLGVRGERQNAGVGRMLKEYQRKELARRHIGEMYWTYDPLIAKNAHFNLNVLGVRVVRFVPNQYGISESPLHHGLPTDRFVVVCDTALEPHEVSRVLEAADARTPMLTASPQAGDPVLVAGGKPAPRVRIEIPTDFAQLLADAPASAERWHAATREHLLWTLSHDYTVTGFRRDAATRRSFYILELPS
jgi:chorismate synthase